MQRSQHRRIRRKRGDRFREPVRNVHQNLNSPNHSTELYNFAICGLFSYQGNNESRKNVVNVQKKEMQSLV